MTAVLRDALQPNLVQTEEGGPAIVHCGPFGNIAHGCNSVIATRLAMALGDYAITEAGFGFDLGGEKFLDIKSRVLGKQPDALVLVATLRSLKYHGGAKVLTEKNDEALRRGMEMLDKHLESAKLFELPTVVVLNKFPTDTDEEYTELRAFLKERGVTLAVCSSFAQGGEGAVEDQIIGAALADDDEVRPEPAKGANERRLACRGQPEFAPQAQPEGRLLGGMASQQGGAAPPQAGNALMGGDGGRD